MCNACKGYEDEYETPPAPTGKDLMKVALDNYNKQELSGEQYEQ